MGRKSCTNTQKSEKCYFRGLFLSNWFEPQIHNHDYFYTARQALSNTYSDVEIVQADPEKKLPQNRVFSFFFENFFEQHKNCNKETNIFTHEINS